MGQGERGLKRLIVTADDFGLALPINEAVENAHARGILTTTSLMTGGAAADDAVKRAKALPDLAVGLHVAVVCGRPTLPPAEIPDLVDDRGRFDDNLVRAGLRYFFLARVRRQLAREIRAQFDAFASTGLALDHVNSHNHMHLHPTVLSMIIRIGRDYGLKAIRLPLEPAHGPQSLSRLFLTPWIALMRWKLRRAGLRHNDYLLGLSQSGAMDARAAAHLLNRLPDGVSEVMFHAATGPWDDMDPAARHYRFEAEYEALLDAGVRNAVVQSGAELIAFRDI